MNGNGSELTASQKRAAHPDFVPTFSLDALCDRLPLRLPVPDGTPPSAKRRYRSAYRYLGYDDLWLPGVLATLSRFELALRLFDFASLRDYLAQFCYLPSAKGQVPFDPVSLFLCICCAGNWVVAWRQAGQAPGWRARQWLETPLRLPRRAHPLGLRFTFLFPRHRAGDVRGDQFPDHRGAAPGRVAAETLHLPRRPSRPRRDDQP